MTPRERANEIIHERIHAVWNEATGRQNDSLDLAHRIETAIAEAVKEERERCAKLRAALEPILAALRRADSFELRAAMEPILAALRRADSFESPPAWNPDYLLEISVPVRDALVLVTAMAEGNAAIDAAMKEQG